jgi:hypothetical protein
MKYSYGRLMYFSVDNVGSISRMLMIVNADVLIDFYYGGEENR